MQDSPDSHLINVSKNGITLSNRNFFTQQRFYKLSVQVGWCILTQTGLCDELAITLFLGRLLH